jgi:hypothetical protein
VRIDPFVRKTMTNKNGVISAQFMVSTIVQVPVPGTGTDVSPSGTKMIYVRLDFIYTVPPSCG